MGIAGTAMAQDTLRNTDFERWTKVGSVDVPADWGGAGRIGRVERLNVTDANGNILYTKPVYEGKYAVSTSGGMNGQTPVVGFMVQKTNFSARPTKIGMIVAYAPSLQGESFYIRATSTRGHDTIMSVLGNVNRGLEPWTPVNFNIPANAYLSQDNPDSILVEIFPTLPFEQGGQMKYSPNTTLFIARMQLGNEDIVGVKSVDVNMTNKVLVSAYPNPATEQIIFAVGQTKAAYTTITVTDVNGRVVATPFSGMNTDGMRNFTMPVDQLKAGVYFYRVQAGNEIATGKFSVVR